jgi:hypothetical protein
VPLRERCDGDERDAVLLAEVLRVGDVLEECGVELAVDANQRCAGSGVSLAITFQHVL